MNNLKEYNKVFTTLFNINDYQLNKDFTFNNVEDWDSIVHLSLITELEDAFNVMFETEDILSFGSYENGMRILEKYEISFN
ncbi:acyl carrier protein [Desulfosporosinus sp.]|uniref:acyl carrier protein n=1 Tax=Desulfosporosinus sp. TaxID=157907 RepID=UPI0023132569|nr:acyl carrier protein [Desulfosporosinus sp.]MCO5388434.1 acyl carrier protein [Desulfosporosinus sp.]MDA8220911.1 acyl carrier protein [Desulfitobacterium hafniense]